MEAAVKFATTVDDLVDSQTLACCCLGPEPSAFVLWAIAIKEKSECYHTLLFFSFFSFFFKCFFFFSFIEMTTKFNQEIYAKMRAKKNEPFSTLGKRTVHVVD